MPDVTSTTPDLTTFTGLDDLGPTVVAQRLRPHRTVLDCRVVEPDDWCRRCGCQGRHRCRRARLAPHPPQGQVRQTLTPIRYGTGPARLLDMVEGRSQQAFAAWLAARPQQWRDAVEVVAMDGFTGFKNAAAQELPEAVTVMDPFHVVRLAGQAVNDVRRRRQQEIHGHRGRKDDLLSVER